MPLGYFDLNHFRAPVMPDLFFVFKFITTSVVIMFLARADAPAVSVRDKGGGRVRVSEHIVLRGREIAMVLPGTHALGALRGVADDAGPIAVWRALGKVARHCAAMGAECLTDS